MSSSSILIYTIFLFGSLPPCYFVLRIPLQDTATEELEGIHILDILMNDKADIQPEILHADTQGQSTTVFGLSSLLGIQLMPRIRNWKDLKLFRPCKEEVYEHIDNLFSGEIDWDLIETHYPDMIRVAMSIQSGKITPSTIVILPLPIKNLHLIKTNDKVRCTSNQFSMVL